VRKNYVTIYHPSGLESKVLAESIAAWERKGWSTAKPVEEKTHLPQVEESESKTDTTEAY